MSPDGTLHEVSRVSPTTIPANLTSNERLMLYSVLQGLYDSQLNCTISSAADFGWSVKLGDATGGWKAEGMFMNILDAARFLREQAIKQYPHSVFATMFVP